MYKNYIADILLNTINKEQLSIICFYTTVFHINNKLHF